MSKLARASTSIISQILSLLMIAIKMGLCRHRGPNKAILFLFKFVIIQKLVIFSPQSLLQETGKEAVTNVDRFNDLIFKA